ncbi:hypothetical protein H4582DRAFT_2189467 [Lactarius indigo]|nr:hypothetical protein H4582DRAFT_2189467 [Lactarius indigo]
MEAVMDVQHISAGSESATPLSPRNAATIIRPFCVRSGVILRFRSSSVLLPSTHRSKLYPSIPHTSLSPSILLISHASWFWHLGHTLAINFIIQSSMKVFYMELKTITVHRLLRALRECLRGGHSTNSDPVGRAEEPIADENVPIVCHLYPITVSTIAELAHITAQTDDSAIAVSNFWEALVQPVRVSVDAAISSVVGSGWVLDVGGFARFVPNAEGTMRAVWRDGLHAELNPQLAEQRAIEDMSTRLEALRRRALPKRALDGLMRPADSSVSPNGLPAWM